MFNQREFFINKALKKNSTVLDVGCVHNENIMFTDKWHHNFLLSKTPNVVGIDNNKNAIRVLKKRGYNVAYKDAQNFDLKKTFDFIIAGEIIEHLIDFNGFFKSLKKHMHKNTKIIITTPNVWNGFNFFSIIFRGKTRIHPEHTCWFCEKTFEQLIKKFDLKIDKCIYLHTPKNVRFYFFSRILIMLGLKKIGGSALYFELSLN
jgi:2-polyprenyl-3-methyl-5-hydroxy-6-metoxy-1,4-benzoquinol methylase